MVLVLEKNSLTSLVPDARLGTDASSADIAAALSERLAPDWEVVRMVDPFGAASVVVFLADEADDAPTYVLYEQQGWVEVATIVNDEWRASRNYDDAGQAIAAIVTRTTSATAGRSEDL